jgi:hypothetical protein
MPNVFWYAVRKTVMALLTLPSSGSTLPAFMKAVSVAQTNARSLSRSRVLIANPAAVAVLCRPGGRFGSNGAIAVLGVRCGLGDALIRPALENAVFDLDFVAPTDLDFGQHFWPAVEFGAADSDDACRFLTRRGRMGFRDLNQHGTASLTCP